MRHLARCALLAALIAGKLQPALAVLESADDRDCAACRTTLTPAGDGLRLDGAKLYVENAPGRDLLLVSARESASGRLRLVAVSPRTPGVEPVALRSLRAHLFKLRDEGHVNADGDGRWRS